MSVAAIMATTLSVVLAYLGSKHQQWLAAPLPGFPALSSAALASIVAATAWFDALPIGTAVIAWLTTSMLVAIAIFASTPIFRHR